MFPFFTVCIVRIYSFRLYSDNWYISISLFNNVLRFLLNIFMSNLSHINTRVLLKYCHFSVRFALNI